MIIISDRKTGWKLVTVKDEGWFFYHPHLSTTKNSQFISFTDVDSYELKKEMGIPTEQEASERKLKDFFLSKKYGEILLKKLLLPVASNSSYGSYQNNSYARV